MLSFQSRDLSTEKHVVQNKKKELENDFSLKETKTCNTCMLLNVSHLGLTPKGNKSTARILTGVIN